MPAWLHDHLKCRSGSFNFRCQQTFLVDACLAAEDIAVLICRCCWFTDYFQSLHRFHTKPYCKVGIIKVSLKHIMMVFPTLTAKHVVPSYKPTHSKTRNYAIRVHVIYTCIITGVLSWLSVRLWLPCTQWASEQRCNTLVVKSSCIQNHCGPVYLPPLCMPDVA